MITVTLLISDMFSKQMKPVFKSLSEDYNYIKFLKVDGDQCRDVMEKYEVKSYPTFVFFKNGDETVERFSGADTEQLETKVIELSGQAPGGAKSDSGKKVKLIKNLEMFDEQVGGKGLVVVDYSVDWCGPSLDMYPIYKDLCNQYTDVTFLKVNGEGKENKSIITLQGVTAYPTFQFFQDGKRVDELVGAEQESLQAKLNALAAMPSSASQVAPSVDGERLLTAIQEGDANDMAVYMYQSGYRNPVSIRFCPALPL